MGIGPGEQSGGRLGGVALTSCVDGKPPSPLEWIHLVDHECADARVAAIMPVARTITGCLRREPGREWFIVECLTESVSECVTCADQLAGPGGGIGGSLMTRPADGFGNDSRVGRNAGSVRRLMTSCSIVVNYVGH